MKIIDYTYKNQTGNLELKEDAIYYLDLSEEKIRAFKKPLEVSSPILISSKNSLFLVIDNKGHVLSSEKNFSNDYLTLSLKSSDEILSDNFKEYFNQLFIFIKSQNKRTLVISGFILVLFFILSITFLSREDQHYGFESDIHETNPNLMGVELVEMRLRLSKKAMSENKYNLAIDMLNKVLETTPDNQEALQLKEVAVNNQNKSKLEAKKSVKKDIRYKELIDEASVLMSSKDYMGALFHVEQILDENPEHVEAKKIYAAIQTELQNLKEKKIENQASDSVQLTRAEELWKKGQTEFSENRFSEAWNSYKESLATLESRNLTPTFKYDLNEAFKEVESKLHEFVKPTMEAARQNRKQGDLKTGEASAIFYQTALSHYYEVKKMYDEFPLLNEEIEITIKKLNESLEPLFTEAQVIKDLEGCCMSQPYLKKIIQLGKFDAIPRFNEAKELLSQCPCL